MTTPKQCLRYTTFKQFKSGDYEITSKVNVIHNSGDRSRKEYPSIRSARESLRRAHKKLFDVLRCNEWQYFITLTFAFDGLGADDKCRCAFSAWSKRMRREFPDMYYVAVPEYHKKGDLHYHIVVGGVTADELKLVDSGRVLHYGKAWRKQDFDAQGFEYDESTGEGMPIFNVNAWTDGFSTATEVRCVDAVAKYVGKYLTKVDIDPRFYNQKRFHCSHNILVPKVAKVVTEVGLDDSTISDIVELGAELDYNRDDIRYTKFSLTREDVIRARLDGSLPMPYHHLRL